MARESGRGGARSGGIGPSVDPVCFSTVDECNAHYQWLVASGTTELSVVVDLPTRLGQDSDTPVAYEAVGRGGAAIDSIDDMRVLFRGIPLDKVTTSMTAGATDALLLLLYQLVAEERGVAARRLAGSLWNDALTHRTGGGTYVFPPKGSLRLAADVFQYCASELPRWHTLSMSGRPSVARPVIRGPIEYGCFQAAVTEQAVPMGAAPAAARRQTERLCKLRAWREQSRVDDALARVIEATEDDDNLMYPMKAALEARATIGEVCAALRHTWAQATL